MSMYCLPEAMRMYIYVIAFIFGCCMGSFLNCAAWRVVRGESFIKGRSRCTACGHSLGLTDLIPVISWLVLKGRCRYCGKKISARYPLTELAFGMITVLTLMCFDLTILCLRNYIFICVLFVLTLTDIDAMIIPDGCHVTAVIAWVAAEPFLFDVWTGVLSHIAAALIFGGGLLVMSLLMDHLLGRESLGGGDIKLLAVTGLYLGIIGTLFALIIACITGLLFNLIIHIGNSKEGAESSKAFPFGPWIAAGTAFMLLFGDPLINWYQNLLI